MKRSTSKSIQKIQSNIYHDPNFENQTIHFGSVYINEEEDEEEIEIKNNFTYNSQLDEYIVKNSKLFSSKKKVDIVQNNKDIDKEEEMRGGNIIFANLINIDFKQKKLTPLYILSFFYLIFSIVEVICGYYSNSIILMADAAHYFSESSCFAIYIVSIYVSSK